MKMDKKLIKQQKHLTQMFYTFNQFCKEHDLVVFLVGGSALGAYRHQGFIPWDDDIDVAMLRPDFEKMEQYMAEQGNKLKNMNYSPVNCEIIPEAPIGHLYDFHVVDRIQDSPKIDIHPIDGVPDSKILRTLQQILTLAYYLGIYHLPVKNKGKIPRIISNILLKSIPDKLWKIILRISKAYITRWDPYTSKNLCSLFGVAGYTREIMPREWLLPLKKCRFDQYEFWIPNSTDQYLTRLYGNWKVLPPKRKRKPQHDSYLRCHISNHSDTES